MAHDRANVQRGPDFFIATLHGLNVPAPAFAAWATILVELICGLTVLVGALIPLVSVPMVTVLVVAMVTVHLPYGFSSVKLLSVTSTGPTSVLRATR